MVDLTVQTLELQFVHLAAQFVRQNVQGTETGVVAGALLFPARVTKTHDQPGFAVSSKHNVTSLEEM